MIGLGLVFDCGYEAEERLPVLSEIRLRDVTLFNGEGVAQRPKYFEVV